MLQGRRQNVFLLSGFYFFIVYVCVQAEREREKSRTWEPHFLPEEESDFSVPKAKQRAEGR